MKINTKILSIPPFISTSWRNIASLHIENQHPTLILVVTLVSGVRIEVPHLDPIVIEAIFATHTSVLEQEDKGTTPSKPSVRPPMNFPFVQEQTISMELPLKNAMMSMENFGTLLQHNPEQADTPDLPPDVLDKISQLSQTLGIDDPNAIPKPEPHCNCMRCQIARAMQKGLSGETDREKGEPEEIITDDDLKFRTWDVAQTGEKLYLVSNPIDRKEHYNVYLGDPIGCTCGHAQCEHVRAVLNT
jgi:hypothetical protein